MSNLPAIIQSRNISVEAYNVMKNVLYPNAQDESIILVHDYCVARKLDPLKKPVHIVPIYDKKLKRNVDTVWPSIAEVRITASRTGIYAGKDKIVFGPDVTKEFEPEEWNDHQKKYVKTGRKFSVTFPESAQITVYKMVGNTRCPYTEDVRWLETYARTKGDAPNEMWQKRPYAQLAKCVEAAALRAAFPEEVGSEYIVEEAHRVSDMAMTDVMPEPKPVTTSRLDDIASAVKATIHDIPAHITDVPPLDGFEPSDDIM